MTPNPRPPTPNTQPRVLMLTGEYPPSRGGVADYTERLVLALREIGFAVPVLTTRGGAASETAQPAAWRKVKQWDLSSWGVVQTALAEAGADLLHIQYQAGAFQLRGELTLLPMWLRGRRPGLKVVTTFHDLRVPYLFPKAGPLRRLAVRSLLAGSHATIFVDSADLLRAGSPPGSTWIPVGSNIPFERPGSTDRAAARSALGIGPADLLVGYFGFLTSSKGAHALLRAMRLLVDAGRPAQLMLIGAAAGASNPTDQADERAARALAQRLGLESRMKRTGYLAAPEVSKHLLACNVIALPYEDGASFRRGSLLAALEHGCPVVTTIPRAGAEGLGERTLQPERQAIMVPSGDSSALADAIVRLADDPELSQRLGANARALAAACSWQSIASETAELYARFS